MDAMMPGSAAASSKPLPSPQLVRREGNTFMLYGIPGIKGPVAVDAAQFGLDDTTMYDHNDGVTPQMNLHEAFHAGTLPKALMAHIPPAPLTPDTMMQPGATPVPMPGGPPPMGMDTMPMGGPQGSPAPMPSGGVSPGMAPPAGPPMPGSDALQGLA